MEQAAAVLKRKGGLRRIPARRLRHGCQWSRSSAYCRTDALISTGHSGRYALRGVCPWNALSVSNDIQLLRETVVTLSQSGFQIAVFGGWAEELHGLSAPREHYDIDLMVIDADLVMLDGFVAARGEVVGKRQTHKRAFITSGVLVELFLVRTVDGQPLTDFWGSFAYRWPSLGPVDLVGLPVASVDALAAYRADHDHITAHRPQTRP